MQESKNSISTNHIKKKDISNIAPFQSYNSLTRQRNHPGFSYLTSSRKKNNKSLFDWSDQSLNNSHICLKHSLPLNSMCFTCNFQVMCQQCIKIFHSSPQKLQNIQHDIRTLEKSCMFIKNTLIHSLIKLEAKCNILTNINQQLNGQKIELFTQKTTYKQQLQKSFQYLHQVLDMRLKQMTQQIQEIFEEHDKSYANTIQQIKILQGYYEKCHQGITHTLQNCNQNNNDFFICHFYSQKKEIIQDIIKENQLNDFKKQIYQIKYKIQNSQINDIIKSLNDIQIGYDLKYTYLDSIEQSQSRPSSLNKILSKVKSQNGLKIKPSKKNLKKPIKYLDIQTTQKHNYAESRLQKQRQSHKINGTFCIETPKQISRQKKFDMMIKKSPDGSTALLKKRKKSFGKMVSMPASPAKQQKDRRSPSIKHKDTIVQGMKKKTTIVKKKK